MKSAVSIIATAVLVCVVGAPAAERAATLPVTADVGICSYAGKMLTSNGTGPTTPIRQNQNWEGFEARTLLMAFDTAPVRGWTIRRADLHLYLAKGDLYGVGLCEVLAPWDEPRTMNWLEAEGGPCWWFARTPADRTKPRPGDGWAWPGSGIYSVAWAHPMARYSHTPPARIRRERVAAVPGDAGKRFTHLVIPLDPALVASLAGGTSYGLILTDDKGQVAESRSLIGPGFPYRDNDAEDIWVFTKDIQEPSLRPRLEVFGDVVDKPAPPAIADVRVVHVEPGSSTVTLEFTAPHDGAAGPLLAYDVRHADRPGADWRQATPLPRWEIPRPVPPGRSQHMPIWTLPPGRHEISIRCVDMAGARGAASTVSIRVPPVPPAELATPHAVPAATVAVARPPADMTVYAVPDMVRIDPVGGWVLRDGQAYRRMASYAAANPVFLADRAAIVVDTPANATAAFQLIVRKGTDTARLDGVKVSLSDLVGPGGARIAARPNVQCFRVWYVRSLPKPKAEAAPDASEDAAAGPVAWHGDACLPLREPFANSFPVPALDNDVDRQTNQAVWVDVFVPKGVPAGDYTGTVTVAAAGGVAPTTLHLTVKVLPLTLSDQPTWPVELNCYGGLARFAGVDAADPKAVQAEWEFYRMAKAHRLMINSLPYSHSGAVDATRCPVVRGDGANVKVADWSPMDRRLGPLLDGSAFTGPNGYVGPGAGTPISHVYLPFHENWPLPVRTHYGDYAEVTNRLDFAEWASKSRPLAEAFGPEFREGYQSVVRQFVEHARAKGWTGTTFQFYLNNKYYYKVAFFSAAGGRTGASFWLLDEPADHDDYAANAFFLGLCRKGAEAGDSQVRFAWRVDVSQPELARGLWDGVADLWMCGYGTVANGYVTTAAVRQKWLPAETFWHYGGAAGVAAAPMELAHTFLTSWCSGASGILPYWTTLGGKDWAKADDLAIYYTGRNYARGTRSHPGPLPGLRMKLLRRCQQDIELMMQLARARGWDRPRVRSALKPYADDPGAAVLTFDKLTLDRMSHLRAALVATLTQ